MNKNISGLILILGLAVVGLSPALQAEVPLTLHLGVGEFKYDSKRDLDESTVPVYAIEMGLGDNWAAEILFSEKEDKPDAGPQVDSRLWQLSALYYADTYLGEANRLQPYGVFGVGELDVDDTNSESAAAAVSVGAGIRWMFTDRFGARLDARVFKEVGGSAKDVLLTAGLNYYFGDTALAVVEVAAVGEPLDSDGDGVTDDRDRCPGTSAGTRVDTNGCPLPVARVASVKLKVNFGFDSTQVEEKYFADLAELAKFLQRFEDLQVDVEGHTDSLGPDSYNQKLSQRRAQAVVDLLVHQHGIAPRRLQAIGYGETRPVADNDSKTGRAENRRVMATLEVEYEE